MLKFKKIKWKNFLSTGNSFTEIDLVRSPSTLITGENGAGKSTMLDAICFALYGKPFRKIKKDQLINSINARDCLVEIDFEINGKQYKIIRGIKPNVFEIYSDGSLLNQSAAARDYQEILEKNILRMNMKSFTQIVILGSSSFVPFMQLSTAARREVLEDLLDIRIFSRMSSVLKDRTSTLKDSILINDKDIESENSKLKIYEKTRLQVNESRDQSIQSYRDSIAALQLECDEFSSRVDGITQEMETLKSEIGDHSSIRKKLSDISTLRTNVHNKYKNAKKTIAFYEQHDHCPTCDQEIDSEIKQSKITKKQESVEKYTDGLTKMDEEIRKLEERQDEIIRISENISSLATEMSKLDARVSANMLSIRRYEKQIAELENSEPFDENLIMTTKEKIQLLEQDKKKLLSQRELYDNAAIILKDSGIKSKVVKQYIPVINSLVNKYLAAMEFFVKFELNENFEEKILSRHRDDFTYDSFSEGEKMRIDLALLFTWRSIARMKNSANTNLLILDEVFDASLDAAGCDEFLEIIQNVENANIFCISHKGDVLQDKFRSAIRFTKQGNFSRIATP